MAEVCYRIKGANGYYTSNDGWEPRAARAFAYVTLNVAKSDAVYARKADPTARVVKTTLKQAKCAGPWIGADWDSRAAIRCSDAGDEVAYVHKIGGEWYWGIGDVGGKSLTKQDAQDVADAKLRKHGWVLV